MSLILEGVDLPEEEETISLMIEPDGTVYFYVWDSTENDKLTSDGRTNAIQIPPHGDLIDRKRLGRELNKRWNVNSDHDFADKEVWRALEEAPAVIGAEGKR